MPRFESTASFLARLSSKKPRGPSKDKRPRCGARCRSKGGAPCVARVCLLPDGRPAKRCRMHGGLSTGARTPQGRAKLSEAGRKGAAARWEKGRPDQGAQN